MFLLGSPCVLFLSDRVACSLIESFAHLQKCSHFLFYFFRLGQAFRVRYCTVFLPRSVSGGWLRGRRLVWGCAPPLRSAVWLVVTSAQSDMLEGDSVLNRFKHVTTWRPFLSHWSHFLLSSKISPCLLKKEKNPETTILTKPQQGKPGRPTRLLCSPPRPRPASFGHAAELILWYLRSSPVDMWKPFGTQRQALNRLGIVSIFPYQLPQGKIMYLVT